MSVMKKHYTLDNFKTFLKTFMKHWTRSICVLGVLVALFYLLSFVLTNYTEALRSYLPEAVVQQIRQVLLFFFRSESVFQCVSIIGGVLFYTTMLALTIICVISTFVLIVFCLSYFCREFKIACNIRYDFSRAYFISRQRKLFVFFEKLLI